MFFKNHCVANFTLNAADLNLLHLGCDVFMQY